MRRSARSNPSASTRARKASTRLPESMQKKARAQHRPQTHVLRLLPGPAGETLVDLRVYFIPPAANTYSTMHYDVTHHAVCLAAQQLDAALENLPRCATPAGVEQCRDAPLRHDEIHRDAV